MKYRKKPVVVEAIKFDGDFKTRTGEHYVPLWAEAALHEGIICFAGGVPTMTVEIYLDSLNKDMFNK
ncbi:hypothetical protein [Peptostreptococcus anaerobius]|uniref:hypothetical protein n=1 Tax=Peptostreptococcus anaerobius TaxID=1261 RepID=UPI0002A2401F|nr:hypothetical protein [Peptostreptococcus anaerobius]EKX89285.1 hypothetical protein HMPREF9998_01720 [Peptostreptococcus anaerobius VPI 4330 = DSM 2949]